MRIEDSGGTPVISRPVPRPAHRGPQPAHLPPAPSGRPSDLPLELVRRDIAGDHPGVPLMLRIRVLHALSGFPVTAAVVDLRHRAPTPVTDSTGVPDRIATPAATGSPDRTATLDSTEVPHPATGFGPTNSPHPAAAPDPTGSPSRTAALDRTAHGAETSDCPGAPHELRGAQVTDADGYAEFRTVHPGRVAGEPVRIDAAVHVGGILAGGRAVTYAGPLFLPEQIAAEVAPGPAPTTAPDLTTGGAIHVVPRDRFDLSAGLLATVTVTVGD
ncbi:hypothetical protein [Actinoplanes sp. G11-F43]|uniref:hypothetical protein n=1 Tax=Actinoplanes sp. G11-F43 TaxID=3424130 RepID=UPI003D33DFD4